MPSDWLTNVLMRDDIDSTIFLTAAQRTHETFLF